MDKYKGKSFAEVAKEIQGRYKNRLDPISVRGLSRELSNLKARQEQVKALQQMQQEQEMMMQQQAASQMEGGMPSQMVAPPSSNPSLNIQTEQAPTFQRQASQDYNSKFALGGETNPKGKDDRSNLTEDALRNLSITEQRELFDKYLKVTNPLTNETQTYGDFRKNLLLDRQGINQYLQQQRIGGTPEKYISDTFNKAKEGFLRQNVDAVGFSPEDFEMLKQKQLEYNKQFGRTTNATEQAVQNINAPTLKEYRETNEYNQAKDREGTERIRRDQMQGLRDQFGNTYLKQKSYANGGEIGFGLSMLPIIGNIGELLTTKKPGTVQARTVNKSALNALQNVRPRQSRFEDVDISNIERGMVEASSRFTQNNINASQGKAGAFAANELANQRNLYKSIAEARMNAQMQNRQTAQMNAQEQARVDAMLNQNNAMAAQLGMQADMFNARQQSAADIANEQNKAAFADRKSQLFNSAIGGVGQAGQLLMRNEGLKSMYGYNIFGKKVKSPQQTSNNNLADNPYYQLGQQQAINPLDIVNINDSLYANDFTTALAAYGGKMKKTRYGYGGKLKSIKKKMKK